MKVTPIVSTPVVAVDATGYMPAITGKPPQMDAADAADNPASQADPLSLQQLAGQLNQNIGMTGQQVQFSVDKDTGKAVLRVTDAESGALLRQIPGDEALEMARILDRMQGVLIRQKA